MPINSLFSFHIYWWCHTINIIIALLYSSKVLHQPYCQIWMCQVQKIFSFHVHHYRFILRTIFGKKIRYLGFSFIFENITRGSLLKLIQTYGNFPENLCALCVNQTLEALHYLHSKGFRHDNLKCSNLLITNLGVVKLSGLGNFRKSDLSKDSGILYEPFWTAPESVSNMHGGSLASEIWSLGCTAIEMMNGEAPYSNLTIQQATQKIVDDDHPPLPTGISQELTKFFVSSCFVKDSKRRSTTQSLLIHPWMKLYESAKKENWTYSEIVSIIRKSNPNKKPKEEDMEYQIQELTRERDLLKFQNQELKEKIISAQLKKKL